MTSDERAKALEDLSEEDALELLYDWGFWARPSQLEPDGDWDTWLLKAGRGFGKTRVGAEAVRKWIERGAKRIALVARTTSDARDTMIEGESGIIAVSPPWNRPRYVASKRRVVWPSGAIASIYTAEEPDTLRGPQHEFAWCDELAAWKYDQETWDNLIFGLRLGSRPRCVVTTTPRPTALVRSLISDRATVVTEGSTFENLANLPPSFIRQILDRYEGTRLGLQELHGQVLDDVEGALWNWAMIEAARVKWDDLPNFRRIVVAVDPGPRQSSKNSETGIVVAGVAVVGKQDHCWILEDASLSASVQEWAEEIVAAYRHFDADRVIAETNDGGDIMKFTIHTVDNRVAFKGIHARTGKRVRAEPVAALYEQGRVHHVGAFPQLEDQMCTWVPGETDSPDRMDALVYAVSELMLGKKFSSSAKPVEMPREGGKTEWEV